MFAGGESSLYLSSDDHAKYLEADDLESSENLITLGEYIYLLGSLSPSYVKSRST